MKKCMLILGLLLPLRFLSAQNDPPPLVAFGQYSNDFYQWSFTVGDLVIWTFSAPQQVWSQGSEQPVITIVATKEPAISGFEVTLFPNPTADRLFFKVESDLTDPQVNYELWDTGGRLLKREQTVDQVQTEIDVLNLPSGSYLLRLTDAKGRSIAKTFIKNTH